MISRRKFLRAGALFLPAAAMGQVVVPNRRVFVNPTCSGPGSNFTAADFEPWRYNSGCGWNGLATITTASGPAAYFRTRTLQFGNKPTLGNKNLQWRRDLQIGNNWSKIRIGLLIQSDATSGTFIYDYRFGVVNSKNWGDAGGNVVGCQLGGGSNWAYSANQYISSGVNEVFAATNVNTVNTFVQQNLGATNLMTNDSGHRTLSFVDITKGSPNYTVEIYCVRAASEANQDMNENDLNFGMGLAGGVAMTISGKTLAYGSSSIAFSEANGNVGSVLVMYETTGTAESSLFAVAARKIS